MRFLATLLTPVLSAVATVTLLFPSPTVAYERHDPPYCDNTGPGYCNLGWVYDYDVNVFTAWIYDRYCVQIGYKTGMGYREEIIDSQLPYTVILHNKATGPTFLYAGKGYGAGCSCYDGGSYPWQSPACQCAFDCSAQ